MIAVALCLTLLSGVPVIAQGEYPRAYDGHPDLSGVWQAIGTAHWNLQDHQASAGPPELGAIGATPPGRGVVEGGEIPYQPWALDRKHRNFENRLTEDPETKCYLPGVPRATYLPYPFQILQGTSKIMIVYGFAEANRTIHMGPGAGHMTWRAESSVAGGRSWYHDDHLRFGLTI